MGFPGASCPKGPTAELSSHRSQYDTKINYMGFVQIETFCSQVLHHCKGKKNPDKAENTWTLHLQGCDLQNTQCTQSEMMCLHICSQRPLSSTHLGSVLRVFLTQGVYAREERLDAGVSLKENPGAQCLSFKASGHCLKSCM